MLWLFLKAFSTRGELNHGARVEQIYAVKYPGDKYMQAFFENWQELINDADAKMDDAALRKLLVSKLKGLNESVKSEEMAQDIVTLERMEDDDPRYTHDWLLERMGKCLSRRKDDKIEMDYNVQIGKMYKADVRSVLFPSAFLLQHCFLNSLSTHF